jgi:hypothetical protein
VVGGGALWWVRWTEEPKDGEDMKVREHEEKESARSVTPSY